MLSIDVSLRGVDKMRIGSSMDNYDATHYCQDPSQLCIHLRSYVKE